jgi:hypothetical protein
MIGEFQADSTDSQIQVKGDDEKRDLHCTLVPQSTTSKSGCDEILVDPLNQMFAALVDVYADVHSHQPLLDNMDIRPSPHPSPSGLRNGYNKSRTIRLGIDR